MTENPDNTSGAALPDPPAANQGKDEPISSSPSESPQSSSTDSSSKEASDGKGDAAAGISSRTPGDQGESPRSMEVDNVRAAANMAEASTMPARTTGGVPTPGDSKGVAVPSVQAAAGSSEESGEMSEVRITAIAPPGKPDGEVDTRA